MHRRSFVLLAGLMATSAVADAAGVPPEPADPPIRVVTVTRGLAHPWSIAVLSAREVLVSERNGGLKVISLDGRVVRALRGVPHAFVDSDGGLLGIALHPQFERNRRLYMCLSTGTDAANASTVIRAELHDDHLERVTQVFRARPLKAGSSHFGCRLLFAPDGTLFVTLGDGYDYRDQAQQLDSDLGKIVRLRDDGAIPADNPFVGREDALPEIYTTGHRNVQGIAQRPGTPEIWVHEHGPRGGDEVNVLVPGANYGWPKTTYGVDYSGAIISELTTAPGVVAPVLYWVPSIAPSGMVFYEGDAFPEWRGDLFVGALAGKHLRRIDLDSAGRVLAQHELLADLGERIRDVAMGPGGDLLVLTDSSDGALLRISRDDRR